MPSSTIKSYAKQSGKSVSEVEKLWDETKVAAKKKFKKEDEHFWAYVSAVTKRKCGISEALMFRDLLSEKKSDKKEQKSDIIKGDKVQLIKKIKGLEDASEGEVFNVNDVDKDGNIKIDNSFGAEWQDKYIDVKHFKKVIE